MSKQNVAQKDLDYTDDQNYQEWLDECGYLFDDMLEEGRTIAEAAKMVDRQMVPYRKWRALQSTSPIPSPPTPMANDERRSRSEESSRQFAQDQSSGQTSPLVRLLNPI